MIPGNINIAPELSGEELEALALFWRQFMAARKRYYGVSEVKRTFEVWQKFFESKMSAFHELEKTIPEIRNCSFDFWRYVQNLHPEGVVNLILGHRLEEK